MSKIAATIVMAQLPNPATKKNITMVCEHVKRSLDIYTEQIGICIQVLSLYPDKKRCSINGRFVFQTKKDYDQFIKGLIDKKNSVLSCFAYKMIE